MTNRAFHFLSKQAIPLLGEHLTNDEFREHCGNPPKIGHHHRYDPRDIRRVRMARQPGLEKFLAIRQLPPVIVAHTSKGGTGKSSVATNMAVGMAMQGWKICLIDGDAASSGATELLDQQDDEHNLLTLRELLHGKATPQEAFIPIYENADLDFLPADSEMGRLEIELVAMVGREFMFAEHLLKNQEFYRKYDFIVIDTGPNTSLLNFNFMTAANLILAPLMLDGMGLKAMKSLQNNLNDIQRLTKKAPPVLMVPNGFHSGMKHSLENLALVREHYAGNLSQTVIPSYAGVQRQVRIWEGTATPLVESEPTSPASKAIIDLSREIVDLFVSQPFNKQRKGR